MFGAKHCKKSPTNISGIKLKTNPLVVILVQIFSYVSDSRRRELSLQPKVLVHMSRELYEHPVSLAQRSSTSDLEHNLAPCSLQVCIASSKVPILHPPTFDFAQTAQIDKKLHMEIMFNLLLHLFSQFRISVFEQQAIPNLADVGSIRVAQPRDSVHSSTLVPPPFTT